MRLPRIEAEYHLPRFSSFPDHLRIPNNAVIPVTGINEDFVAQLYLVVIAIHAPRPILDAARDDKITERLIRRVRRVPLLVLETVAGPFRNGVKPRIHDSGQ